MSSIETLAQRAGRDPHGHLAAFKAAAGELGWTGAVGRGVTNHITGDSFRSWAKLAEHIVDEAQRAARMAESEALNLAEAEAARAENEAPGGIYGPPEVTEEVAFTYYYTTRVPTVRLSDMTVVDAYVSEEIPDYHEGKCQSGAALACAGVGFLRVLPESMLPGSTREQMIQCLPCYEASAEAYVRKLHHYPDAAR